MAEVTTAKKLAKKTTDAVKKVKTDETKIKRYEEGLKALTDHGTQLETQLKKVEADAGTKVKELDGELKKANAEIKKLEKKVEEGSQPREWTEEEIAEKELEIMERIAKEQINMQKIAEEAEEEEDDKPKPVRRFIPAQTIEREGVFYVWQNNRNAKTGGYDKAMADTLVELYDGQGKYALVEEIPAENLEEGEENKYLLYKGQSRIQQVEKPVDMGQTEEDASEEED